MNLIQIFLVGLNRWLPLIIAFIAGSFALIQIRHNNVTNARLRWLDNLKLFIVEFFSECMVLQLKKGVMIGNAERIETPNSRAESYSHEINTSIIDHLKIVESKFYLIKLNLNPKEDLHIKFEKILNTYMEHMNTIPIGQTMQAHNETIKSLDRYSDKIIVLSRFIIKLEWEKTKKPAFLRFFYFNLGQGKKLKSEALKLED